MAASQILLVIVCLATAAELSLGQLQAADGASAAYNFYGSNNLPPAWAGLLNSSASTAVSMVATAQSLVAPQGMSSSGLAGLQCAAKCRAWQFCYAFYYNATASLCHTADQGQFETYWVAPGNDTAAQMQQQQSQVSAVSYIKLYHDVCVWLSWSSWSRSSDGSANICNAPANRTRVRQCTCPAESVSVGGWCRNVKNQTDSQASFISWCQWSQWTKSQSNNSADVCNYWQSRLRARNCTCPVPVAVNPPISPIAVENISQSWQWCPWDSWSYWADAKGNGLFYNRYSYRYRAPDCNTEFTRTRTRDCGCSSAVTGETAGATISELVDRIYTIWGQWTGWGDWKRDCDQGNIVRSRSRQVDSTQPTKIVGSVGSAYDTQKDAWCSWSSWNYDRWCHDNKKRYCNCGGSSYYTSYVVDC